MCPSKSEKACAKYPFVSVFKNVRNRAPGKAAESSQIISLGKDRFTAHVLNQVAIVSIVCDCDAI